MLCTIVTEISLADYKDSVKYLDLIAILDELGADFLPMQTIALEIFEAGRQHALEQLREFLQIEKVLAKMYQESGK